MQYESNPFYGARPSLKNNLRNFLASKSALNRLIIINIAVFIAFFLFKVLSNVIIFLMNYDSSEEIKKQLIYILSCPDSFEQLLRQPWSIVTSIFFHTGFWHLFMNMLMLYIMGTIFRQYLDGKKLVITYFAGGIFGNLFYMAAYNLFPVFATTGEISYALGASGSIMAIMAAITVYRPNHELNLLLLGRTKLYWITVIFIAIDLFSIPQSNAGGHIAHLGGAIYGAISILFYRNFSFPKISFRKKNKKKKFTTSYDNNWHPISDEDYNANKAKQQKRVDKILDKISQNGYDALTKEEKDFLFSFRK